MGTITQDRIAELERENQSLAEKLVCKRCGFDNKKDSYDIDEELLKDYYRKLLTQNYFSKEYALLDDNILLVLEEPTNALALAYGKLHTLLGSVMPIYAPDLLAISFIKSIKYKTDDGLVTKYEADQDERYNIIKGITVSNIDSCIPEYFKNLNQVVAIGIKNTVLDFHALCISLGEATRDKNFWKGAGLV